MMKCDIWKDKPASWEEIFPISGNQAEPGLDDPSKAHRIANLRSNKMGLCNYPGMESQIQSQIGRTHFPPLSEWKAKSAWRGPR